MATRARLEIRLMTVDKTVYLALDAIMLDCSYPPIESVGEVELVVTRDCSGSGAVHFAVSRESGLAPSDVPDGSVHNACVLGR